MTAALAPDPRRPFVLDTRPLGRRPGSMWESAWTVRAPEGLGRDLVRIPAGADLELDVRLEAVLDGVLVTATVAATTTGECARCLDEAGGELRVDLTELFSYPEQAERFRRTAGSDAEADDEVRLLDGDLLDLEQVIRDAVVLALPSSPLCRPDCGGLCAVCGVRLDEAGPAHAHDEIDPRWAGLRGLEED